MHGLWQESTQVTAHLLVPGWTCMGITYAPDGQKPEGNWRAEQAVERMIHNVEAGDFHIICPDDNVSEALDVARMMWRAQDMNESRAALSRWHLEWTERFERFAER